MAHSYIQSFDDELQAFRHFVRSYPDTVLLVDTYDTLKGVQRVIELRTNWDRTSEFQAFV
jgi:nicotinate phosphoribosyltransferase